jgi:cell division septal protein FtsQ
MVVTSVSKTTIFGRILFVLMVFILAFGGVFFYQYYNKTKDLKNTPSVSLSGNTTTANGILSNKDDEIILHATLDASDAIVT